MKKKTIAQPLADAAAQFIAANAKTRRASGKPRKQTPTKKGKKAKATRATPKRAEKPVAGILKLPAIGKKLTRTYNGKDHVVEIVEGGFRYEGTTYSSLTALAKEITGYKAISGPAFFGLWKRAEDK